LGSVFILVLTVPMCVAGVTLTVPIESGIKLFKKGQLRCFTVCANIVPPERQPRAVHLGASSVCLASAETMSWRIVGLGDPLCYTAECVSFTSRQMACAFGVGKFARSNSGTTGIFFRVKAKSHGARIHAATDLLANQPFAGLARRLLPRLFCCEVFAFFAFAVLVIADRVL
jgi:hypothetical protein